MEKQVGVAFSAQQGSNTDTLLTCLGRVRYEYLIDSMVEIGKNREEAF